MSSEIDLHVHSTCSDGTYTPLELVLHAKTLGIKAFALTDHDTIDGIHECVLAGEKYGVEVIPGIEFSCDYGFEVHILGLFINEKSEILNNKITELVYERNNRNINMVKRINELGFDIKMEELQKMVKGKVIGRPHFAELMVSKGYVESMDEAFEKYLREGRPGYVTRDKKITPKEAIKIIRESGGISIIAHAGLIEKPLNEIEVIIKELVDIGLGGIEVYHSEHDYETSEYLVSIAQKYKLQISGGSDFHGLHKDVVGMGTGRGNLVMDYSIVSNLKKYLANRD